MKDVERALLGDRAAQERLTENGVLIPCAHCGGTEILEASSMRSIWYFCSSDGCEAIGPSACSEYEARLAWNSRAAILSPEQLDALEKLEGKN